MSINPSKGSPAAGGTGSLKLVIGLVVLLLAFFGLRNCQTQTSETPPAGSVALAPAPISGPAPVPPPVSPPATPVDDGLTTLTLPDGTTFRAAADGVESKLLAFITDGTKAVDKTTWFTMDRLEFETGSATLRDTSNAQLDDIAAILKAFPAVKLKLGGYTDNTGEPASNRKLSGERAATAVAALVSRGVDPTRLEAEGYGDQFPVAGNATAEGRQRNRRTDVHVTQK
jgi:OOP family OmpA-OmpF porin